MARNFGALGIGGLLMLTSLAAAFGIMPGINLMAWGWLGLGALLLQVGLFSMRFLAYATYKKDANGTDAAKATGGAAMAENIRLDWVRDELFGMLSIMGAASAMDSVNLGYWMSLSGEDQNKMWEDWKQAANEKYEETYAMRKEKGLVSGDEKDGKKEEKKDKKKGKGEEDEEDEDTE